jgi:hypothetical protein
MERLVHIFISLGEILSDCWSIYVENDKDFLLHLTWTTYSFLFSTCTVCTSDRKSERLAYRSASPWLACRQADTPTNTKNNNVAQIHLTIWENSYINFMGIWRKRVGCRLILQYFPHDFSLLCYFFVPVGSFIPHAGTGFFQLPDRY